MLKKLTSLPPAAFVLDVAEACDRAGTARAAAALAYFLILTLFPLLVWVNFFLGQFRVDLAAALLPLEQFLPSGALDVVEDYLSYAAGIQSPALLAACLFTILVSASAGLRTVFLTLEDLFGAKRRSGIWRAVLSVILSVLLLLTIYLSVVVVFTGDWFFSVLETNLPAQLTALLPLGTLAGLWGWLRYLLLFSLVLLLVLGVYGAGIPRGKLSQRGLLGSALLSAGALAGTSAIFSWFIGLSSRYALVYGSLASLIVLLMWLYFCGTILLLGAAVGSVWAKRKQQNKK